MSFFSHWSSPLSGEQLPLILTFGRGRCSHSSSPHAGAVSFWTGSHRTSPDARGLDPIATHLCCRTVFSGPPIGAHLYRRITLNAPCCDYATPIEPHRPALPRALPHSTSPFAVPFGLTSLPDPLTQVPMGDHRSGLSLPPQLTDRPTETHRRSHPFSPD